MINSIFITGDLDRMGVLLKYQYDTGKYKIFYDDYYVGNYKLFIIMSLLNTFNDKILFDMFDTFDIEYELEYNKEGFNMSYDYADIKSVFIYIR